jgi:hypothetical protein
MNKKLVGKYFLCLVAVSLNKCVVIWSQQMTDWPPGKTSAFFIYHPKSKALLLFDGSGAGLDSSKNYADTGRNDVWKWDGESWKRLYATGPGLKSLSAGALNKKTGLIHVFGGVGIRGYESKRDDMWSFDGLKWVRVPANNIGSRDHHKIVYMDHIDAFLLYGGADSIRQFDSTTWILKNSQFTRLTIPGPGTRYHFALAYDAKRQKVILFGGGRQGRRDETWEFDGQRWEKISTKESPGQRLRHNMVYDEDTGMTVLHGGDEKGTTWAWDGKVWKKIAEGGPVGDLQALGYDPVRKSIFVFGGSGPDDMITSDVWELKNQIWRKISGNGKWKWMGDHYERISK